MDWQNREDTLLLCNSEQRDLLQEYYYLASLPVLSPDRADRMLAILERAEMDGLLHFWICEIDLDLALRFDFLDRSTEESRKNQLSRLQEFLTEPAKKTAYSLCQELQFRVTNSLMEVQKNLKISGFDPGPIDGCIGRQTRDALQHFQRNRHLKPDGILSQTTQKALGLL